MKIIKFISWLLLLSIFGCKQKDVNIEEINFKYEANWESLAKHEAAPEWFQDAKLGIYFHWGVYSVPAYGSEWYPRNMYLENSDVRKFHEENYGTLNTFNYHDFIPMFKAEQFDPEDWADLFQNSGAKFAGPVAQHHDGFAMWDSEINPWNVTNKGPQRDILGELFNSLEKRNLKTIATFHHARLGQRNANKPENWNIGYNSHYVYHPDLITSTTDPELRKLYGNFESIDDFHQYWLNQVNEVVEKYDPDIIWYDSWLDQIPEEYRMQMAAFHFNNGLANNKEVVTCHKQDDMPMELSILDFEQGGRRETHPMPWMTDITISNKSWSYVNGQTYKDAGLVVRNMIDVWSKNGIVLLNISPTAEGIINKEQRTVLKQLGDWLKVHGEAVYGTRPYTIYGYGPANAADGAHGGQSATTKFSEKDVRFTISKDRKSLYAFFLGKPQTGERIQMRLLGAHRYAPETPIKRVTLLGTEVEVNWEETTDSFYLTMPDVNMDDFATVFKFELE